MEVSIFLEFSGETFSMPSFPVTLLTNEGHLSLISKKTQHLTGFKQGMFIVDPNPSSYDGRLKQLNQPTTSRSHQLPVGEAGHLIFHLCSFGK